MSPATGPPQGAPEQPLHGPGSLTPSWSEHLTTPVLHEVDPTVRGKSKIKPIQHRTQDLKFRKMSSKKQAKKRTECNTCGQSFPVFRNVHLAFLTICYCDFFFKSFLGRTNLWKKFYIPLLPFTILQYQLISKQFVLFIDLYQLVQWKIKLPDSRLNK